MDFIAILNVFSFLNILAALIVLVMKLSKLKRNDSSILIFIISFLTLLFATSTNVLENSGINAYFDLFEDEIEIVFIPLFIFAILSYNIKKELLINSKNEQQLEESNFRLNISMEGMNQALWEWQPEKKQFVISKKNYYLKFIPACFVLTESNKSEFIHNSSIEQFEKLLDALIRNNELPDNNEILLKTSNGEYNWVLVRGKKNNTNIKESSYFGALFDISGIKKIQTDLALALEKAEESNKLKAAFLANLSHEIRTPMNGIIGFTDLLRESDLNSEKRLDYIKQIHISGQRLLTTINDIVDISKIDSGQVNIVEVPIEVCKLLYDVIEQLTINFLVNDNTSLAANCDNYQSLYTKTDLNKLNLVLTNLITNAIKFTRQGKIEVGFNLLESSQKIEFYVKDSGIGIDKKYHDEIFERFRQLKVNYSNLEGLGLGLSIAKAYIELMGGEIWLESEIGLGSKFYFTIPYKPVEDSYNNKVKPNKESSKPEEQLILVAEDDDSNYFYLVEILCTENYRVKRATNGLEAVKACKNDPNITLVLMDIKMPELNGLEATRQIKAFRKKLPIIAQTAYAFPEDEEMIRDAGCDGYIAKPIVKEKLFEFIHVFTENKNLS